MGTGVRNGWGLYVREDLPGGLTVCMIAGRGQVHWEASCLGHWGDFGVEVEPDLGLELWIEIQQAGVR